MKRERQQQMKDREKRGTAADGHKKRETATYDGQRKRETETVIKLIFSGRIRWTPVQLSRLRKECLQIIATPWLRHISTRWYVEDNTPSPVEQARRQNNVNVNSVGIKPCNTMRCN